MTIIVIAHGVNQGPGALGTLQTPNKKRLIFFSSLSINF